MPGLADLLRRPRMPISASLSSHRILLYSLVSALAVSAAIANALKNHSNFYSVAIYLSRSNRSVLVLANFGLLIALLCGRVFQQIFFGPLRPTEIERLYDRLWFFVTESLLAFTIFRDDFDIPFALMFGFLLFVKSFHWLASDRIEWMDQRPYPGPPTLFHVRMNSLLLLLWSIDFVMFAFAVESTLTHGVNGMVLFASEYAILMASAINTGAKYILSVIDLRRASQRGGENAPPWENKSMWVFYIELTTDFLKLATYLVFFTLIITFYGLPLNIVRDVYVTARSFITRLRALQRYQRATRNMDERYPDATEAEMGAMSDRTCIICREEMILRGSAHDPAQLAPPADGPNMTPKKLPCGHIFHFHCLRSWLERQQSCPTCRRTVLDTPAQGEAGAAGPGAGGAPAAGGPAALPGAQAPANNIGAAQRGAGAPARIPVQGDLPGWGQPGGPNGVLVQYNIHYQIGRQAHGQHAPVPPPPPTMPQPPLQPAPLNNGFVGPDGAWQPWEVDQRWFGPVAGQEQPAPAPAPAPTPTVQATEPTNEGSAAAQTGAGVAPTAPPELPSETENFAIPSESSPPAQTPREAAALAALRRFGSSGPTSTSSSQTTLTPETPASNPAPSASSSLSASSSFSSEFSSDSDLASTPTATATAPSAPNGAPLRVDPVKVPTMIPLYEFHRPTSPRSSSLRQPYFRPVRATSPRPRPTPTTIPAASNTSAHINANAQHRNGEARTPLGVLPATLTDAQLATLDRVTRAAIDERLRVLEGVSGAVHRCIEELMRVRSALPADGGVGGPEGAGIEVLDQAIAGALEAAAGGPEVVRVIEVEDTRPQNVQEQDGERAEMARAEAGAA